MNDEFIPVPTPAPAQPHSMESSVRRAVTWLTLAVLAAAVVVAFASILQVIGIWFTYQYVPIARGILAVIVAVVALYVARMLVRKQPL